MYFIETVSFLFVNESECEVKERISFEKIRGVLQINCWLTKEHTKV
jgi:hypothetical protein